MEIATRRLHSIRSISLAVGMSRAEVRGLIGGLKLPVYSGSSPTRGLFLDDAGMKRLREHIGRADSAAG
jgi:hypothetical protein